MYKVWKTNMFNDEILTELVAVFYDFKKAREFVECQSTLCENHVIIKDGKRIDID